VSYVLPVLWMTPCFHIVGAMGQNQARRCLAEVRQVAVPVGGQDNHGVWSSSSECGTRGKVSYVSMIDLLAKKIMTNKVGLSPGKRICPVDGSSTGIAMMQPPSECF